MAGAISIPRDITERSWANNPTTFYLFMRLLLKANWQDGVWYGIPVGRGELITSVAHLSKELHLKDCQTRYGLKCLQNDKRIICQSTNRFTKVTICEFDTYQFSRKTDSQAISQTEFQTDSQTNSEPDSNNRINRERDKMKKENKPSFSEAVERIYALYPSQTTRPEGNNVSLKSAKKDKEKIRRMLSSGEFTEESLSYAITRYTSEQKREYLKIFNTFLNQVPDYSTPEQGTLNLDGEEKNWLNGRKPQE